MEKIRLTITGIVYSSTQSGSYVLTLREHHGKRELPIVIGSFEAQSIAIALEKISPNRPLTHDLIKLICTNFDINIKEIVIYRFHEGVFFAKILCEQEGRISEIDCRTSDAVAVAVRTNAPIYTHEEILKEVGGVTGLNTNFEDEEDDVDHDKSPFLVTTEIREDPYKGFSLDELNQKLNEALENEEYELASKIRDEIQKRRS